MMSTVDIEFSRALLKQATALVKEHFPEVNLKKDAWTYHFHGDHWEFHGPDGFHWYGGASNGFEACYKGWMAWLKQKGIEE